MKINFYLPGIITTIKLFLHSLPRAKRMGTLVCSVILISTFNVRKCFQSLSQFNDPTCPSYGAREQPSIIVLPTLRSAGIVKTSPTFAALPQCGIELPRAQVSDTTGVDSSNKIAN